MTCQFKGRHFLYSDSKFCNQNLLSQSWQPHYSVKNIEESLLFQSPALSTTDIRIWGSDYLYSQFFMKCC